MGQVSELNLVHEGPYIENSSPARLQQILGIQRAGNLIDAETCPLILNENRNTVRLNLETDIHLFIDIQFVPMLNRVGNRFPNGHSNPMSGVLIKMHEIREAVREDLNQIEVIQSAANADLNLIRCFIHSAVSIGLEIACANLHFLQGFAAWLMAATNPVRRAASVYVKQPEPCKKCGQ